MAKSNGLRKKPQEIVRRSPSPTPPPSPMKSNRAAYNNGSTRTCSTAAELKMQQSIESDEGGYDYHHDHHQEMLMTASTGSGRQTEVANANDSEAATETVEEEEDRCDDAASETGTYTIGKDSPSPDEDQSRRDIDRVFGLLPSTSLSSETCVSTVISAVGQVDSIESRSTPQWIREWAAQVAQQQETPLVHIVNIPANVAKPPSHPRPPPPELPTAQRPRRRLPSVPPAAASNSSSRSRSSPRPSDMSDPSDSSLETESFLRDTESVVSAMQVRVEPNISNRIIGLDLTDRITLIQCLLVFVDRLESTVAVVPSRTPRPGAVAVIVNPSIQPPSQATWKIATVLSRYGFMMQKRASS